MKELMLGNKAIARGLYEAGSQVRTPALPVPRLLRKLQNSKKSTANGHPTRRSLWRPLSAHQEQARDLTAQ